MRWLNRYQEKRVKADEAVKVIKSGDNLWVQPGCAIPTPLLDAMVKRADELEDVKLYHILAMGHLEYMEPQYSRNFRHIALFIGHNSRKPVNEGRADAIPIFLGEVPQLVRDGFLKIDVSLIQVSPPDEHGFCSFGVDVGVSKMPTEHATIVIAMVNPRMPRALGDSFIHVNKIDYFVEHEKDLPEMPQFEFNPDDPSNEIPNQIGSKIVDLIDDGSTLQMGIGTIPDAVLYHLREKRDLGIHTEMFADGIVDLVEEGVITNEKKTINKGKIVAGFVLGTRRTFDFVDNNPIFEFRPQEYVNDIFVISQHENMVAINSAIEIDITGQVCSDSIGTYLFSGFGGQLDFIRGAARSKGGKPIIALPSTAKEDTISRIVPSLKHGGGVVTTRGDVHWIVTEYGAVNLHGKNYRERAKLMISVAHPDYRDELEKYAKDQHLI